MTRPTTPEITRDTITNLQIDELHKRCAESDDVALQLFCNIALGRNKAIVCEVDDARQVCAEAYNRLAKSTLRCTELQVCALYRPDLDGFAIATFNHGMACMEWNGVAWMPSADTDAGPWASDKLTTWALAQELSHEQLSAAVELAVLEHQEGA